MSDELKPCPFCGHHEMYFDHHVVQPDNLNGGMWRCAKCDSSGPDGEYWHDREEEAKLDAAKKWNTRHIPKGYALVPIERIQISLETVQNAMQDAYSNAYLECCGRSNGSECCGMPDAVWNAEDHQVMDALAPAQRELSALIAAAQDDQK